MNRSDRESNIELLRILAMFLIVFHHFSLHTHFSYEGSYLELPRFYMQFLLIGGKIGVNLFILISGYFMSKAADLKLSKLLKLWLQMVFYAVGIYAVCLLMSGQSVDPNALIRLFFPVTTFQWWFGTAYFLLMLLSPLLNAAINNAPEKPFIRTIVIFILAWCIIPRWLNFDVKYELYFNGLLWMMIIYFLGGYIRRFGLFPSLSAGRCIGIAVLILIVFWPLQILCDYLGVSSVYWADKAFNIYYQNNSLVVVAISLFLFLGFSQMKIGSVPWINTVSAAMFGVYLIHDDAYLQLFFWNNFIGIGGHPELQNSLKLIPYSILVCVAVFLVCTVIDLIRIHTIEKLIMIPVSKLDKR